MKVFKIRKILKDNRLLTTILDKYWGDSGDLGSVEYPFTAITPRPTLIWSGSTCKGSIYGAQIDLY